MSWIWIISIIIFWIIFFIFKTLCDKFKIRQEIKNQRSKMVYVYHPFYGFMWIAKTQKDTITYLLFNGWKKQ